MLRDTDKYAFSKIRKQMGFLNFTSSYYYPNISQHIERSNPLVRREEDSIPTLKFQVPLYTTSVQSSIAWPGRPSSGHQAGELVILYFPRVPRGRAP